MSNDDIHELHDRNLVPADEIDHLNILRYPPRDPPTVAIFDPPTRCYRANEEWAKHIMGAVTGLQAWKAWTGEQDELNEAVQSIMEFMVGEVCAMFLLRQSPVSNCLLEQSTDGGDTWTPAFDYSLCMGGGSDASITIYINIAIANLVVLNQLYIDAGLDITIMYPNVEYDSGPQDADRDTALCYSIEALTEGIYNAAEAVINQQISRVNFLSQVISGLTGGYFASDGNLIAALAQSVVDAIFGTDALEAASDALANADARRAVVCCIYDNLQGNTATYALWQLAGAGCGFGAGTDEELLLDVLTPIFAGLDAYLSWITLLSNGVDLAITGLIGNDCDTCGTWTAFIDFKLSDGGYVQHLGSGCILMGVWTPGVGWVGTNSPVCGGFVRYGSFIDLTFAVPATIGQITQNYDLVKGFNYNPNNTAIWLDRTPQATHRTITSALVDGTNQDESTNNTFFAGVSILQGGLMSAWNTVPPVPNGTSILNSMTITGEGPIPPELAAYII